MLQSGKDQHSDDDRWPMWDHEVEIDDEELGVEGADVGDEEAGEQKPIEHKTSRPIADKRILAGKQTRPAESSSRDAMKFTSLGTELFAAVIVGTLIGWAIYSVTGRKYPWIIVIGVVIGAAAGFLNVYRMVVEEDRKEKRAEEQRQHGSSK